MQGNDRSSSRDFGISPLYSKTNFFERADKQFTLLVKPNFEK
jgi:hypothetical protein